jgi:hypothetical protein
MMLYLLDANVLINANRDYYSIDRVPEYWDWLIFNGENKKIKIPLEIYEEITQGNDALSEWAKTPQTKTALLFQEEVDQGAVQWITYQGYGSDLDDVDIEKIGRDPFLISYARQEISSRCIVTTEVSKPNKNGSNRHIPDVCDQLQILWCDPFEMYRRLDFRTNWR